MKIMEKGNRFASLNGITDAGNGHFKYCYQNSSIYIVYPARARFYVPLEGCARSKDTDSAV